MKPKHTVLLPLFIAVALFVIFKPRPSVEEEVKEKGKTLTKSFTSWWSYYHRNINFSENYMATDEKLKPIDKAVFLNSLRSGAYVPIRLRLKNSSLRYALYRLSPKSDSDIVAVMRQEADYMFDVFDREGKELPDYSFTDIHGSVYNKVNTRGKFLVIKCWFIGCKPCVAEFPQLNELVKQYKNRNDILFLSLATDPKPDLEAFIQKRPFSYAVAPVQRNFMNDSLQVSRYPTHIIVNPQGRIVKVVDRFEDLQRVLKKVIPG